MISFLLHYALCDYHRVLYPVLIIRTNNRVVFTSLLIKTEGFIL